MRSLRSVLLVKAPSVILAKARISLSWRRSGDGFISKRQNEIPAFAGMTGRGLAADGKSRRPVRVALALGMLTALAACAHQASSGVAPEAPGFLFGLWHGFIFPISWVLSLFMPDVAVYAVPNNGGWYDFGYFLGIAVFGIGARKTHVIYRDRVIDVRARRIQE